MRTTALLIVMNLLVVVASLGIFFIARTIAVEWTPAFGLGFTIGVILSLYIVRFELGHWP